MELVPASTGEVQLGDRSWNAPVGPHYMTNVDPYAIDRAARLHRNAACELVVLGRYCCVLSKLGVIICAGFVQTLDLKCNRSCICCIDLVTAVGTYGLLV